MTLATLRYIGVILGSAAGAGALVAIALLLLLHYALKGGVDEPRHWWE